MNAPVPLPGSEFDQLRRWLAEPSQHRVDAAEGDRLEILQRLLGEQLCRRLGIFRLPEEFREVIVLRELEDLSYKEIAAIASIPIGTVMSRLARARKLMLQHLQHTRES